jgi:AraC-like DNA-binding protein
MNLLTYTPPPPLAAFVDMLWLAEGPAPPHRRERLLPTGTTELVIDLRESSPMRVPMLSGPHSESFVIDTAPQTAIMGVHFRPGGAFPFFKAPAGQLHNIHLHLDALWGRRAAELREQLLEAQTPPQRFRILERLLLAQAVRPLARHPAVDFALHAFRDASRELSVSAVVDRTGWSQRRFIEVFRDEVGLTPKLFCRIIRFQQVLRLLHGRREIDWASVAAACGYYDQAHFINDFRDFSGFSPTAYLRDRGTHLNHVPLTG